MIYRGTTPTLKFTFPFDITDVEFLTLTFVQGGKELLKKNLSDFSIDGVTAKGVVQLSDAVNSDVSTTAATSKAVKQAYDLANGKADKSTTLAGYGITDAYTKAEVDAKVSSATRYKGSVENYAALPTSDQVIGDMYNVQTADSSHKIKAGDNVVWNGTDWDVLSGTVDLTGCVQTTDYITNGELDEICV